MPSSTAPPSQHSNEYFGGLLDAQLGVSVTKTTPPTLRVMLACDDERVFREMHTILTPARETIIRKPGKRDSCVALLTGEEATKALAFAAEHCLMKKAMAAAALAFITGAGTLEAFTACQAPSADDASPTFMEDADVSAEWISGFFDVRGTVTAPTAPTAPAAPTAALTAPAAVAQPIAEDDESAGEDAAATETETDGELKKKKKTAAPKKKRVPGVKRGTIKIVLPKSEKYVIPMIQKVVGGKVKRSSPCRIVFDSKDHLAKFIAVLGDHVRVKRSDLAEVTAVTAVTAAA